MFAEKTKICIFTAFLFLLALPAQALEFRLEPNESTAEFQAIGKPSMLKIKGKDAVPSGSLSITARKTQGQLDLDLNAFTTGLARRDEHMKDKYLETQSYPKAVLDVHSLNPQPPLQADGTYKGKLLGKLSLHGVSKDIVATLSLYWSKGKFSGDASFSLNLSDYNIAVPSFAGVTVANTVDITVHVAGSSKP